MVQRSKGKSAVAAAAYRSGTKLVNEWDGMTHDYTRKGGIVHSEILLPAHAPPEFQDRSALWNSAEQAEKSSNSQLAREIEVALPVELSRDQQLALVRSYVQDNFVSAGMCADFALHDKLTAQKDSQYRDMRAMREEIKSVERLRKAAEQLSKMEPSKEHEPEH